LKETLACVAFVTRKQPKLLLEDEDEKNLHAHLRTTMHVVDVADRSKVLELAEDVRKVRECV
jgi:hypothetical protein